MEVEVVMLSSCIRRNAIIVLPLLIFVGHPGAKDSHKKKFTPLIPAKSLSVFFFLTLYVIGVVDFLM